jgi:aspartyl-tRNA(Asn)/glutamyl-tRNA(Gln) amidotransferase subunit C
MTKNNMKIDVRHVAKLANLSIKEEDIEKFETQLSEVLDYINKLDEVDVTNVVPTSQVTGLENVSRVDEPRPSLTQEEALSGAAVKHNGFFAVKGIFDEE